MIPGMGQPRRAAPRRYPEELRVVRGSAASTVGRGGGGRPGMLVTSSRAAGRGGGSGCGPYVLVAVEQVSGVVLSLQPGERQVDVVAVRGADFVEAGVGAEVDVAGAHGQR